jgi:hypothetical protein
MGTARRQAGRQLHDAILPAFTVLPIVAHHSAENAARPLASAIPERANYAVSSHRQGIPSAYPGKFPGKTPVSPGIRPEVSLRPNSRAIERHVRIVTKAMPGLFEIAL